MEGGIPPPFVDTVREKGWRVGLRAAYRFRRRTATSKLHRVKGGGRLACCLLIYKTNCDIKVALSVGWNSTPFY